MAENSSSPASSPVSSPASSPASSPPPSPSSSSSLTRSAVEMLHSMTSSPPLTTNPRPVPTSTPSSSLKQDSLFFIGTGSSPSSPTAAPITGWINPSESLGVSTQVLGDFIDSGDNGSPQPAVFQPFSESTGPTAHPQLADPAPALSADVLNSELAPATLSGSSAAVTQAGFSLAIASNGTKLPSESTELTIEEEVARLVEKQARSAQYLEEIKTLINEFDEVYKSVEEQTESMFELGVIGVGFHLEAASSGDAMPGWEEALHMGLKSTQEQIRAMIQNATAKLDGEIDEADRSQLDATVEFLNSRLTALQSIEEKAERLTLCLKSLTAVIKALQVRNLCAEDTG